MRRLRPLVDALKIVTMFCGERGTGFPDFVNDGIVHGEGVVNVSGVQTMGKWSR